MNIVEISALKKCFDSQNVINVNNYSIESGKGYVFYGYNGCGKTTLLRLIAGLEKPSSGKLDISIPKKERVMCFQQPYMFTGTVLSNCEYGVKLQKRKIDKDILNEYCNRYGINSLLNKNARILSSGQKQAVSLIRSFMVNPRLLLLDEPIANIDKKKFGALKEDLKKLKNNGGTFIITMHSDQRILFDIDHCCLLENGDLINDIICTGSKEQIVTTSETVSVKNDEELLNIISKLVVDNGISCSDAFRVCDDHKIGKKQLIDLCNLKGIKIRKCQWGCFK